MLIATLLFGAWGAEEAGAFVRVGAGLAVVGDSFAPLGRVVVDVLPLWFITLSVDAEYWLFSASSHQLLPFMALSLPLIFPVTLGAAPIVTLSSQGVGVVPATLAIKGGLGLFVGPFGVFGEMLVIVSAPQSFVDGIFFAAGVTVGL